MDQRQEPRAQDDLRPARGLVWWTAAGALAWLAIVFIIGPILGFLFG